MTDKQIKDGIDVSQCECYSVEDNSCNDTLSGSCIKEKCQTFRLLQTIKAKEQECEELKKEYWKLEQGNDFLAEKNSKLKGCLTEIKFWARELLKRTGQVVPNEIKQILQKISECEVVDENK